MEHSDIVNMLDQKYGNWNSPDKVQCPNEGKGVKMQSGLRTEHGHLGVHASGSFLICGVCGYQHPIARP